MKDASKNKADREGRDERKFFICCVSGRTRAESRTRIRTRIRTRTCARIYSRSRAICLPFGRARARSCLAQTADSALTNQEFRSSLLPGVREPLPVRPPPSLGPAAPPPDT
jgi:hypothetical protein